ncbi:hypothetical protein Hokovirus_2_224 [Hokovirus HKV1]|uniref:Uncharacterized protein n=1 Tax=Hokovirus HKV1 TaxID=1977638 RepID=A0A1V0SG58_9VIRU|nr:hypothetical protein Hokovirus_2_224 [Hokovirus HKV1]
MELVESYALGTKTKILDTNKMNPENDYYKQVLFNHYITVTNSDRLYYAMYYLQVSRFRTLLIEYYQNNSIKELINYYKQNILTQTCTVNHPSNIYYYHHNNYNNYDDIFWCLMSFIKHDLDNYYNSYDMFSRNALTDCISKCHIHYALVLLNYGFILTDQDYENKNIMSLDDNYKQSEEDSSFRSFIKSDKCKIIQSSSLPIGTKLLSIANECPITLEKINHPIIARDCQVYEYLAFKKHILLKGYISPVLNIKIEPYIYHILENRFEKLIKLI